MPDWKGNLVDFASASMDCDGETRVVSGNPVTSLLYQKIMGTQSCGTSMPYGALLDPSDAETIFNWINSL